MINSWGKRKKHSLGLVVLAAATVLSACGQNNAGGAEPSPLKGAAAANQAGSESGAPKSDKLVVYSALNEDDMIQLKQRFKEDTGIEMEYLNLGSAGEASTRVQAEKSSPKADVLVGGSVEFYQPLAEQGVLEKYTSPNVADIDAKFNDPNGYWQGWYMGVLGIVLNTERYKKELEPKGVQEPRTWDDLLDPAYKGQFVTSNPATAGGGYIFVADQLFRLGEQQGWDYLKKLNANVHHYTPKAGDGIQLTATGEFIAGMSWAHDIVKSAKQGYPIKVIVPEQTAYEIGGAGIIHGGANTDNARKFMDWLLTKETGELNTKMSNRYSVRGDVAPPEGMIPVSEVDLVDYDRAKAAAMKADVVKQFTDMAGTK
ncbi:MULTISPECIES: ABC transporter substrate-binding protein [unclassified Paenibacillus]|uniref:ABC transporter substrate-binding protein n=1 Tax=unclassified Paenibacillus TaxID=185978 RepID=UPI000954264C|nr:MULTISPECIES: ABC transporter substrate-binding protein [unclassified Paenibacillus]ASS65439.1 ABC transporter substrate-binding protein [Paenibacillus sp. RUD330]SIQ36203.1 iron(III) transport system substrate-binding protein [Paenibacillus sp. RU4X]SIQ58234.1 iron(III) transport system substrate-binding protein [Paenibacillus sp. RU4T]